MDAEQSYTFVSRNPSPTIKVNSGGEDRRLMRHSEWEGLLVELSSKKPHLSMCSVEMEKRDFTLEAGHFRDLLFGTTSDSLLYVQTGGRQLTQGPSVGWGAYCSQQHLLAFGSYTIPSPECR